MIPLYKQYENAAPVGVYTLSNFGGLAILDISSDGETAVCAWHWGDGYQKNQAAPGLYNLYRARLYPQKRNALLFRSNH